MEALWITFTQEMKMADKQLTDTQKKIISVSTKKFAKNGYQNTSLADIAKSAKISKGTLFYHYPSKEDLFFVTLTNTIESAFIEEFDFYEKHGFKRVPPREKDWLLEKYWSISARQIETSVVLADKKFFAELGPIKGQF